MDLLIFVASCATFTQRGASRRRAFTSGKVSRTAAAARTNSVFAFSTLRARAAACRRTGRSLAVGKVRSAQAYGCGFYIFILHCCSNNIQLSLLQILYRVGYSLNMNESCLLECVTAVFRRMCHQLPRKQLLLSPNPAVLLTRVIRCHALFVTKIKNQDTSRRWPDMSRSVDLRGKPWGGIGCPGSRYNTPVPS